MGLLNRIFGGTKDNYPKSGVVLVHKLATSLNLPGWQGKLPGYTPSELEAIEAQLSDFQRMADSAMGEKAVIHPDAIQDIQRTLAATALTNFADGKWRFLSNIPENWKELVSTYLKAWSADMSPNALVSLGGLFLKASRPDEVKQVCQVLLLFPAYAKRSMPGKEGADLAEITAHSAKQLLDQLD